MSPAEGIAMVAHGINERMAQIRAVNQRAALPWYLQARGRNFETLAAEVRAGR